MDASEVILAAGTAVITALVALLSVFIANRAEANRLAIQLDHERHLSQSEIQREKLEELYALSANWVKLILSTSNPYLRVMKGNLDYNQALDMTIASGEKEMPDYGRISMLVDLYFPQLRNQFDEVLEARDSANKIKADHKSDYEHGNTDATRFVDPYIAALLEVSEAGRRFSKAIASVNEFK